MNQHEWVKQCLERYAEEGAYPGDGDQWEKAHYPAPKGLGDDTIELKFDDHQVQGILQSEEYERQCFWVSSAKKFLTRGSFVDGWFDLWDIWEKWVAITSSKNLKLANLNATPEERSERSKKANAALTEEQRAEKSRKCSEAAARWQASRTPEEKSESARLGQMRRTPEEKSEASRRANADRRKDCWKLYDHQKQEWVVARSGKDLADAVGTAQTAVRKVVEGQWKTLLGRYTLSPEIKPGRLQRVQHTWRLFDHHTKEWVQAGSQQKLAEIIGGITRSAVLNVVSGRNLHLKRRFTVCPAIIP